MAAGPGGVTHRCTLLTQGVHPTLFMLGPLNSLRKFPGPQVLTAWSRLTFGVSPSRGGSGLARAPSCAVVENPAPHGARIPSWPWALPGDSIPPPHSVGTGFSLEEGCGNVPHTGSWPVPIGVGFPVWTPAGGQYSPTPLQTGLEGQAPAAFRQVSFF